MLSVSLSSIRSAKLICKVAANICRSFTTFQQKIGGENLKTEPKTKKYKIYRYNPETDIKPHYDEYTVTLDGYNLIIIFSSLSILNSSEHMLLDALIKIKNTIDPTLTFRRYD